MKLAKPAVIFAIIFAIILKTSCVLLAQSQPNTENGVKAFGSYTGSAIDTVNLQNGNVMAHIPLFSYPQRGKMALSFSAQLNSKNWQVGEYTDINQALHYRWMLAGKPGLALAPSYDVQMHRVRTMTTDLQGTQTEDDYDYAVSTPDGSIHWLSALAPNGNMMTVDGTNFQFHLTRGIQADHADDSGVLTDSNGVTYYFPSLSMSFGTTSPASGVSANIYAHVLEWRNTKLPDGANEQITYHDVGTPSRIVDPNGNTMIFTVGTDGSSISGPSFDVTGRPIPFEAGNTPAAAAPDLSGCATSSTPVSAYLFDYPGPSGQSSTVKACFTGLNLAPTFSQPSVEPPKNDTFLKSYPPGTIQPALSTLIMPGGTSWTFTYDLYGNITSIGLPTGGSISYSWIEVSLPTCGDDTKVSRAVATRTINDPVNPPQIWQYTWGTVQPDGSITNYVLDPNGNETAHVFNSVVSGLPCAFREVETKTYSGTHASGTLLKTVDTHYIGYGSGNADSSFGGVVLPDVITTTLPGNKVSQITRQYDSGNVAGAIPSYGTVTDEKVYDYGTNGPGPLLRETATTYQWQVNSAYFDAGHINLPASVIVKDGSGCKMAETDYAYDEPAYANVNYESAVGTLPAGTHQGVSTPRGNPTTTTHMLFDHSQCTPAAQTAVSSHTKWYDTGEAYQHIDPLGHTTTVSYDLAYGGMLATQTCSPQTGGVNHCVSGTYDFLTGLLESFTNENATAQAGGNTPGDSAHTSSYSYDTSWRPTSAQAPPDPGNGNARAQTGFTFGAAYPFSIQKQKSITNALADVSTTYLDGAGRANHTEHAMPGGTAKVDTAFDGLGQAVSVSNPYFTTSDATYGVTQPQYDGLGRTTQTTKQDGSVATVDYSAGNCSTSTDEAGKQRRSCSDALGRLIEVDEPGDSFAGTYASGSATVAGTLASQSGVGQAPATQAHGSVTLWNSTSTGGDLSIPDPNAPLCQPPHPCQKLWDSGWVQITVNGTAHRVSYGQLSNLTSIASALVGAITSGVTASAGSASCSVVCSVVISFTAAAGAAGNSISITGSSDSNDDADFGGPGFSFSSSNIAMSGGSDANPGITVWDKGNVTATVDGYSVTVPYGQSTNGSGSAVATALAAALNVSASPVTATASGTMLMLNYKTTGGNGTIGVTSASTQTQWSFPANAFTGSGTMANGEAASGPGVAHNYFVTLYQWDALGNMLCVEQRGDTTGTGCSAAASSDASSSWRVRRFTYDSLSRILTATNPESGTIAYSYDADGELLQKTSPAPNQTGTATQTVSYCYDALHRMTGKGYGAQSCPLATPVVSYAYDSGANAIGKLTSLTDQAGTASYTYDSLGRLATETRVIAGVSKSMSYSYNLDGSLRTLTNPSGAVVTYTPDSAGRTLSAVDSGNGINYVTGATYGPDSGLTGFISGNSGTFAGITNAFSYNKRLQPLAMSAASSSQTVFSLGYDFHLGNGDNGNVFGITNYKDTTRNQSFTYDALNRLISAQNAGTDCTVKVLQNKTEYWGNSYGCDAWGNLLAKTVTKCSAENLVLIAAANNQLVGYGYDAAGNMTNDPTDGITLNYDQENRLTGASGYTYTYDADGNRVKKSNGTTGTLYWYMTPGVVAESDLSGNLTDEYVFFDGERVARKDFSSNTVAYYFSDHLKTASVITDSAGVIKAESDYYPWGGELQFTNNDTNHFKYGGHEHDSETGLEYYGARNYSNGLGRYVTPDWASKAVTVPYADFGNPQSLNLYGYAKNSPISNADMDGHCDAVCIFNTVATIAAGIGRDGGVKPYAKNLAIGSAKGLGALAVQGGRLATAPNVASGIASQAMPLPNAVTPSNTTQAQASAVTQIVVPSVAGLAAGPAIGALEGASIETTTVMHFTSDAGMAAITDAGGVLRGGGSTAGTFVVPASEIPAGASSSQVEGLLEIGPGKGANSVTFDTPNSNLALPDNGTTTSGGATQFRLNEPTPVDTTKFTKTDPR